MILRVLFGSTMSVRRIDLNTYWFIKFLKLVFKKHRRMLSLIMAFEYASVT